VLIASAFLRAEVSVTVEFAVAEPPGDKPDNAHIPRIRQLSFRLAQAHARKRKKIQTDRQGCGVRSQLAPISWVSTGMLAATRRSHAGGINARSIRPANITAFIPDFNESIVAPRNNSMVPSFLQAAFLWL
jgi:hypothetical protein